MQIPDSWTFKTDEVAQGFDEHVREQLPWYDALTQLVAMIARHYLPAGAVAYDIGASTGNMGKALEDIISARNIEWVGIDDSPAMAPIYRAPGRLEVADAIGYNFKEYDLAICFLSMMFLPADKRRQWLLDLIAKAKTGGAVIIVDKQQPQGGILSTALHRYVMGSKIASGANAENVLKKELSLCGIQRPLPVDFFDGLNALEFFRFGDFAGWIIEKKE